MKQKIAIIGGGASGFFAAITAAEKNPNAHVVILEKTSKLLSKVRVSGGGRCNVTNTISEPVPLSKNYPRGEKVFKELFKSFSSTQTQEWFQKRGLRLKTEEDGRVFPITDSSESVIECFLKEAKRLKIEIKTQCDITAIEKQNNLFTLKIKGLDDYQCNNVIMCIGGHHSLHFYDIVKNLGHQIISPIPSLFTFNIPHHPLSGLMGISKPDVKVKILGSKFEEQGALLVTHWGLSGPAILKLSAFAATLLHEKKYHFQIQINWIPPHTEDSLRKFIEQHIKESGKKTILINPVLSIPKRLWERFCILSLINENTIWSELSKKSVNKLVETLLRSTYEIKGKTTFKEEFVTCGGIPLEEINPATMESKHCKGLFFAGEILNVDGITGGFNFQAAWTSGWIAGNHVGK